MPCPAPAELNAWFAGSLLPAEAAPIAAHVSGCATCRAFVAALTVGSAAPPTEHHAADPQTETAAPTKREGPELPKRPATGSRAALLDSQVGPGSLVGRYVIVSELGKGGMGSVYAAYDPQLDRKVAVKLLHPKEQGNLADTAGAARLQREAQALARVSSPYTVAVYDVGVHDRRVFIAMEHLEGKTLRQWLRDAPHPWQEAVDVLRKAGAGLTAVHAAGLVHRDFKPTNVIVTADGQVKVLDFGLARISTSEAARARPLTLPDDLDHAELWSHASSLETPLTEEGSLSGTPGYMAPELLSGESATVASDQFAFGVTLYQALYGRRPFAGNTFLEFGKNLRAGLPKTPPAGKVPKWLYPIILKCLAFKAADRFATLAEALEQLGRNPAMERQKWAVRASIVPLILVAAVAGTLLGGPRCPSASEYLGTVWPEETRSELEATLLASKPESGQRITAALDQLGERVRAWAKESAVACRAATHRGAKSIDLQRTACLTRRGQALRILVDAISQADPVVVARSDELVDGYLADTGCADAQLGRAMADDVPAGKEAVAKEVRASLLRSKALDLLDRGTEALAEARIVAETSRDAGLLGFEAEALGRAASIEYYQGDQLGTIRDYGRSMELGLAAGTDDRALRSGAALVGRLAGKEGRLGEAKQVLAVCEALWLRLGADEKSEMSLIDARNAVLVAEGKPAEAVAQMERGLELAKKVYGPRSKDVVGSMVALAAAQWEQGKIAESNRLEAQAAELFKELKGPDDPMLATRYITLGMGLTHEGRRAEGIALLEAGLKLAAKSLEENDSTAVDLDVELSQALEGVDEPRALKLAQAAVEFYEKRTDEESLSNALLARSRALAALGRTKEAQADCKRTRELATRQADPNGDVQRSLLQCDAEAAKGDVRGALEAWSKAWAVTPKGSLPDARGKLAFSLAKALTAAGKEPDRARALAKQALEEYSAFPGYAAERKDIEAWLAAPKRVAKGR